MATSVLQVAQDIRFRCNFTNASYPSDAQLINWINTAQQNLYSKVCDMFIPKVTYYTVTLTGVSNLLALPSDFKRFRALDRQITSGLWQNVDKLPYSQRNATPSPPNVNGTFQLRYYPNLTQITSMSQDIDPIFDGNGWWTWISLDVCCDVMGSLQQDTSYFQAKRADQWSIIRADAPNQNVDAGMILDASRNRQAGWGMVGGFPMPLGGNLAYQPYGYVGPEAGNLIIIPMVWGGAGGY